MRAAVLLVLLCAPLAAWQAQRPNVVLILADDLGWSDLGCYGGEIPTPNLDRLAGEGLRLTQMYSTGRCCPTRASLLTGLWPHQAGIGHMTSESTGNGSDWGWDAYRGTLSPAAATFGEVLGAAGYRTIMSGKWHVGTFAGAWPRDRGFDRFFGMVRGASNFWRPSPDKLVLLDRQPIEPPPDFYITDAFTDNALAFLREAEADDGRPFLLYLAYTAPHWPLHAAPEDVARHRGRYAGGWDALRAERHARQKQLGVVDPGWALTARDAPDWEGLDEAQRDELDHRMALYAAQVEVMDRGIGRVVALLEELGELDDTLLVFLADNGGCAEGGNLGGGPASQLSTRDGYFLTYGKGWANASNTPFVRYKHWVHEGGIASPCVVRYPPAISDPGGTREDPAHLVDLMATFVDVAGAGYPARREGRAVPPMEGTSLLPLLRGERLAERAIFFEHEGNAAVRRGDLKLVARQGGDWELYDMAADRTETRDLAGERPEQARALQEEWQAWADRVGVRPWPVRKPPGFEASARPYPGTWEDLRAAAETTPPAPPWAGTWVRGDDPAEALLVEPARVGRLIDGRARFYRARFDDAGADIEREGRTSRLELALDGGGRLLVGAERVPFASIAETPAALLVPPMELGQPVALGPGRVAALCAELGALAAEGAEAAPAGAARLHELLAEVGWIDAGRFGDGAARDAWLLAQRSADLALLRAILPLVREADPRGYARTFDRVRTTLGFPQRFGSQLGGPAPDRLVLLPLEDPTRVEVRRREVGLGWLSEHLAPLAAANGGQPVRLSRAP